MLNIDVMQELMKHKDDIYSFIFERFRYESQASALKGNIGVVFHYPAYFDNDDRMNSFYQSLNDAGYTVIDSGHITDTGEHYIEVYWALD